MPGVHLRDARPCTAGFEWARHVMRHSVETSAGPKPPKHATQDTCPMGNDVYKLLRDAFKTCDGGWAAELRVRHKLPPSLWPHGAPLHDARAHDDGSSGPTHRRDSPARAPNLLSPCPNRTLASVLALTASAACARALLWARHLLGAAPRDLCRRYPHPMAPAAHGPAAPDYVDARLH